jgi:hypothetical protein
MHFDNASFREHSPERQFESRIRDERRKKEISHGNGAA